jgi:hypothetical protein
VGLPNASACAVHTQKQLTDAAWKVSEDESFTFYEGADWSVSIGGDEPADSERDVER